MTMDVAKMQRAVALFLVLDTIAITISLPYFVDYVIQGLGGTAESASILIAIRASCTAFAAPALGGLSDRIGRKSVALIVVFGSILTMLLELRSVDFWSYMLSRVTFGLTRAAMPVANGVIVDLFSSAEERSAALSKNGAAVGVGFLIGAALGGVLVGYGYHVPTLVCLVAQIVNVAVVLFLWSDSKPPATQKSDSPRPSFLATLTTVSTNKTTSSMFLVHVLIILVTAGVQHAFMEYMRIQLDMSAGLRSSFLLSIGILSAIVQSNLTTIVNLFGGRKRAMVIGCAANAVINVIAPLSNTLSPQSVQGSIMGLNESLLNVGTVIGPLFCTYSASIDYRIPFFTSAAILMGLMYKCQAMSQFDQTDSSSAPVERKQKAKKLE